MDLQVNSNDVSSGIHKQVFQLKPSRKDGLVLQVHHTVPAVNGEIHRVRFVHIAFDNGGEKLATADHRGNIFIIDLASSKYWMLSNLGSPCSVIAFSPYKQNEILVGTSNCELNFINIETGHIVGCLKGHSIPPTQISFTSDNRYCLAASSDEGIIWDLKSNSQANRLAMIPGVAVKKAMFMPVSNNILACFQDDTMHVWKLETFECLKQIIPEAWKSHHLKTISFTKDGRAMVIGGHTPTMVVFALDNWTVKKVINLPDGMTGVRHIHFLPQLFDGGANKILGVLPTNNCSLHFLDIESSTFLPFVIEPESPMKTFACSSNGKYISSILQSGEVNVYSSSNVFDVKGINMPLLTEKVEFGFKLQGAGDSLESKIRTKPRPTRKNNHASQQKLSSVNNQINETLDLQRLKPILKEFGEYPKSYRMLIWKTLLHLPANQESYVNLVHRDCHPAYTRLEDTYPLENKAVLRNLKRLLSCLANWSPLFGEVKYLPLFVFPFVKVFFNDPFVCFEAVATIIVNWCQHWFEYFPYPPVNVLAMVENVLAANDPELMEHFYELGVTSQLYAWTLLENALSEVFSPSEWLRLWDHVLSNEPSFLIMVVVSYNITCRAALKSCKTSSDFEYFYHNQNPIDMKRLISKTYSLCRQTKDDIHPRQYLKEFIPMEKGIYPVFNKYPKFLVDYQAVQMETIRKEEEEILKEQQLAMELKRAQEKRLRSELRADVQAERLLKLEEVYRDTLIKEEERVASQRHKVMALRRDLRSREVELLDSAKERLIRQQTMQRSKELDRLLNEMNRKRVREDTEVAVAEEEMRRHYTELLTHKHELEREIGTKFETLPATSIEHTALTRQQEQLTRELHQLRKEASLEQHSRQMKITTRIAKVDEMMQRVDMELAKEMAERQHNLNTGHGNLKTMQLESETKELEKEVEHLLEQLTDIRVRETKAKHGLLARSQVDRWELNEEQHNLVRGQFNNLLVKKADSKQHCNADRLYPIPVQNGTGSGEGDQFKDCFQDQCASTQTQPSRLDTGFNKENCLNRESLSARSIGKQSSSEPSFRSTEFYTREKAAVLSAMDVREKLLMNEKARNNRKK